MSRYSKKVLITGGGGFIGSNLIRRLFNLNYSIHLIWKRSTNPWRIKDMLSYLTLHEVDLLQKDKLSTVLNKVRPSVIFHLATYSAYRNQEDVEKIMEVNIKGTLNLLLASKGINYDIFVNTGSSSEYGIKNKPMEETDILNPVSFYAVSKASATLLCQVFAKQYKKPIITIRPFSVYGPYEEKDRFIPTIIRSLIQNQVIYLTIGSQRRDFIYIDDVVEAYISALKKGSCLSGEIINIGTGIEYSNDEVVKTLFQVSQKKVPVKKGAFPLRIWDTKHWVADISKAKKILHWKPLYPLEKGLKATYEKSF